MRQLVFEVPEGDDEDDEEEGEGHTWPEGFLGTEESRVEGAVTELYSNDLCQLTTLELGAGTGGAYTCNFGHADGTNVAVLLLNLGTAECSIQYESVSSQTILPE